MTLSDTTLKEDSETLNHSLYIHDLTVSFNIKVLAVFSILLSVMFAGIYLFLPEMWEYSVICIVVEYGIFMGAGLVYIVLFPKRVEVKACGVYVSEMSEILGLILFY